MIKLDKLSEPEVLRVNKAQWTEEYKTAKEARAANLDQIQNRYRHPEVKEQLLRETHEKCAYCESKITHIYPGDVEHKKPKSGFNDDVFEWTNLTLACGECNRRKSNNYDEDISIIDPYEVDPADHLYACGALIVPRLGDPIGKLAYELFELDRSGLLERRVDHLRKLRLQLEVYASEKNELLKKLYERRIKDLQEPSTEYAMVTRAFVEQALGSGTHRRRRRKG